VPGIRLQFGEDPLSRFREIWWSLSDHTPSQTDRERIFRSRPGRSFFKESHSRIRFNLFNFSKGPHSRDMLTWKPNSRTQRMRLGHVLSDQTIFAPSVQDILNKIADRGIYKDRRTASHLRAKTLPYLLRMRSWRSATYWWRLRSASGRVHGPNFNVQICIAIREAEWPRLTYGNTESLI
jgi:hypothetical protein